MSRAFTILGPLALLLASAPALRAQTPLHTWNGTHVSDFFGDVVEIVGDVDDDGIRDIAVGAPHADFQPLFGSVQTNRGRVSVFSGATGAPLLTLWGDPDGFTDFGEAIADAGDVNFDGHDDLLVGAPRADSPSVGGITATDAGVVELRSGANGALLHTFFLHLSGTRFGSSLATADFDSNSLLDVAIGAPRFVDHSSTGSANGRGLVQIYRISDGAWIKDLSTPDLQGTFELHLPKHWGAALDVVGDSDGDSLVELIVGAPRATQIVFPSQSRPDAGLVVHVEVISGQRFLEAGGSEGDRLGSAVAALGDADSNGFPDLLVGAPGADVIDPDTQGMIPDVGQVRRFGVSSAPTVFNGSTTRPIGHNLAALPDLTDDGKSDFLIGSPLADTGVFPFIKTDVGRADLYSGADGLLVDTYFGANAGDHFGTGMAGARLFGDNRAQLALGAPWADANGASSGSVFLFERCADAATWSHFGPGLPGTLGVPDISGATDPVLGETFELFLGNSSGANSVAYLFLGFGTQSVPTHGGTLLVNALIIKALPLPAAGRTLNLALPDDPALCGVLVHGQALQLDPGAVLGVSFTQGIRIALGM